MDAQSSEKTPTNDGSNTSEQLKDKSILCNDPAGLCLSWQGIDDKEVKSTVANSGIYTNLCRLASQLSQNTDQASPLITLETEDKTWLIKEYDGGHAVVMQVPSQDTIRLNASNGAPKG